MTDPNDPSDQEGFWTNWQLVRVAPNSRKYAAALGRAATGESEGALQAIVAYGEPLDVVIVWFVLPADNLACAIERSLQFLVELIDQAALRLPGRIELIAGNQGRAPERTG